MNSVNNNKDIKHRVFVLLMVFLIFFTGITARLAYIQFSWSDELRDKAESQWTRELGIYPKRGTIYDKNGVILAASVTRYSLQAIPNDVKNKESVAMLLSPILDMTVEEILDKLSDTTKAMVWVKRLLTDEEAQQVRALIISGLELIDEPARVYPFNNMAAQVLGFTMKYAESDGHAGQDGIELYYNEELMGEPGVVLRETDNSGKDIPYGSEIYVDAQDGNNLVLTLDATLQQYLQEEAETALLKHNADGVYALATNPYTGEILAMVNLPDYDPNEPPRNLSLSDMQVLTKNMTCQLNFEPGSTLKAVLLAAALEEGVVTLEDEFYCPGYYEVDGHKIHCNRRTGHGRQTVQEGLNNSCNPVFMQIGERLGKDKVYEYYEKFGFGQKTGVDISGEEQGIIIEKDNAIHRDWVTMCFGQAIAVTPIQMITAFNAVVNGGYIITPHILDSITKTTENDDGTQSTETIYTHTDEKVQVISEKTSEIMRKALTDAVTYGGGAEGSVDGFNVGGKTGTSQTYDESGNISNIKVGSYIGFGPTENAKISMYFIVYNPKGSSYGSYVAAPRGGLFMEKAFEYYNLEPSIEQLKAIRMRNLIGLQAYDALAFLKTKFFDIKLEGEIPSDGNYENYVVVDQSIRNDNWIHANLGRRKITLTLKKHTYDKDQVQVPNLEGMTLLEATAAMTRRGLVLNIGDSSFDTDGVFRYQDLIPGKYVDPGTTVTAYYHRPSYEE